MDKFFERLNAMKDITIGINKEIHDVIDRELKIFQKANGIMDVSKRNTPEGIAYNDRMWMEVIEPILVSALGAVISLFVQSKFPKEEILREIGFMIDDHIAVEQLLFGHGPDTNKNENPTKPVYDKEVAAGFVSPKDKSKLN